MTSSLRPTLSDIGQRQSLLGPKFVGFMRWTGGALAGATALGALSLGWATMEAKRPTVRRFDIPVQARPGLKELTILHLSDLHMFAGQDFITSFIKKIAEEEHFDFVVSTGDNLGDATAAPLLLEALAPLLDKPGAFVLGSNDYYSPEMKAWSSYLDPDTVGRAALSKTGIEPDLPWVEVVHALTAAGWIDLTNQNNEVEVKTSSSGKTASVSAGHVENDDNEDGSAQLVALIGVDDPHIKRDRMPNPNATWWKPEALRLALTHSPYKRVLDRFAALDADIILAGHTHGGQLRIPGVGALVNNTDVHRRYSRGLNWWSTTSGSASSALHVSAGLGTSRYAQVRFACRPEVSLLRVCPVG